MRVSGLQQSNDLSFIQMRNAPALSPSAKVVALLILCPFAILLATYMTSTTGAVQHCIFCSIIAGEMNTTILVETDDYVIFADIKPASKHHYLAVSKRHIESVNKLTKAEDQLVASMADGLRAFFTSHDIDPADALFGFHIPPFISVKHLHMHAIAPRSTMGFIDRSIYKPGSFWFKTVDEVRQQLPDA